jgi:Domain of unknown function (DUF4365)
MTNADYGLGIDGAKSRYSLSYLYAVCAHAGCTVYETPQDSDVHSVDGTIQFQESDVRVQMKCSSAKQMADEFERVDLKDKWIAKWKKSEVPVYVVLVVVPTDKTDWVGYGDEDTLHKTRAYWARFKRDSTAKSIRIPRNQRFGVDTIHVWHEELVSRFGEDGQ